MNTDLPVVKMEPVEAEDSVQSSSNGENASASVGRTDTWIKVQDISLTFEDKCILEKLTDKHINCAQQILKLKFPIINGLRLTLLQNDTQAKYKQCNSNFSCE